MNEPTTCTVALRKREIKGLLRIAAKQDIRYYLNGVCLDFDAGVCVASDGHMLVAFRPDDMAGKGQTIVARDAFEAALRLPVQQVHGRVNAKDVQVSVTGMDVLIAVGSLAITSKAIDGKYLEWVKPVPRQPSGLSAVYNPEYLATMHHAVKELTGDRYTHFTQNGNSTGGGPGVMLGTDYSNAFAIVMPMMRTGSDERTREVIASFLPPVTKAAKTKKRAKTKKASA